MDKQTKTNIIDSLVTVGYYWMSAENVSCALTVQDLLTKLNIKDKQLKKRIDGLKDDCHNIQMSNSSNKNFQKLSIPKEYEADEDTKLLWVTTQVLLNIFNCGDFEMGFTFLMEMSHDWQILYFNVITVLKKSQVKEELTDWLTMHFLMAADLNDSKELELAGYKIEKIL